jgi:hypothetical protein
VRPASAEASASLAARRIDLADRVAAVDLKEAFVPDIYRRLLAALPELRRYRELRHREAMLPDGRSARPKLYLYPERDFPGYRIGIHGDSRSKAITAQFWVFLASGLRR